MKPIYWKLIALATGLVLLIIAVAVAMLLFTKKDAAMVIAPESTFFAVVQVEEKSTLSTDSDGDLWPTAWAEDGNLYSANGDGKGFNLGAQWSDIVMNQIVGDPETGITGYRLGTGN